MKTFEEIYENIINKNGEELNKAVKELKNKNKKLAITTLMICLIIDIIYIILKINKNLYTIMFTILINLIIIVISSVIAITAKERKKYLELYKKRIIKSIIDNFYNNVKYLPFEKMPENIYKEVNYENYNKYYSDDYFIGLIDNKNKIEMAEVVTKEERTYEDSEGNTKSQDILKFKGLFSKIEIEKSIENELQISKNNKSKRNKVEMDSQEFEKSFDVNCTNKIVAMQILTADIMEELISFKKKYKIEYDIYIKNNIIYLRFHCGNMFETGNLKKGIVDKNLLEKYFNILNFTYKVSNKLIKTINDTEI